MWEATSRQLGGREPQVFAGLLAALLVKGSPESIRHCLPLLLGDVTLARVRVGPRSGTRGHKAPHRTELVVADTHGPHEELGAHILLGLGRQEVLPLPSNGLLHPTSKEARARSLALQLDVRVPALNDVTHAEAGLVPAAPMAPARTGVEHGPNALEVQHAEAEVELCRRYLLSKMGDAVGPVSLRTTYLSLVDAA